MTLVTVLICLFYRRTASVSFPAQVGRCTQGGWGGGGADIRSKGLKVVQNNAHFYFNVISSDLVGSN